MTLLFSLQCLVVDVGCTISRGEIRERGGRKVTTTGGVGRCGVQEEEGDDVVVMCARVGEDLDDGMIACD